MSSPHPPRFRLFSLRRVSGKLCLSWFCLTTFLFASSPSGPESEAKQIIRATGVKGGLLVHLGCGDGKLTSELASLGPYLVHGLDSNPQHVTKARRHIRKHVDYGEVSVETLTGKTLPYTENLVNLLVAEDLYGVEKQEIMRVLAPRGVAYIKRKGRWEKKVKPWPAAMDEWTHALYDATNNAVCHDEIVGPPKHLQWVGSPKYARSHDHLATISALVSSKGRIFYIVDKGPTEAVVLPAKWYLVARDAFSGVVLWERRIPDWEWHLRGFRSGPSDISRRLVAVGDEVYVTLGYNKPVAALNAETGRKLRTYQGTEAAREILWHKERLFVVTGHANRGLPPEERGIENSRPGLASVRSQRPAYRIKIPPKGITALRAATGEVLWRKRDGETKNLMPTTLCAKGGRIFFENSERIFCLKAETGEKVWTAKRPVSENRPAWSAPTLVAYGDVLLSADRSSSSSFMQNGGDPGGVEWIVSSRGGNAPRGLLMAFAADTGKRLWSSPCQECYNAPVDVLVSDSLVWTGELVRAGQPGITEGLDPGTGKVKRTRPRDQEFFRPGMGHHRCFRNKATGKYLILGRAGVEFIDVVTGKAFPNHWTRGTCQLGVMPCNGLLYAPSHSCACFIEAKLTGFNALAPHSQSRNVPETISKEGRLEEGPAYGKVSPKEAASPSQGDWPTYRRDASRSGFTNVTLSTGLKPKWKASLHKPLSSIVIADGKVFVSEIDAHTVHALNSETGRIVWSFTTGGRVDSPPTVYQGRALFGSADGYVYCVRLSDGALVWRFLAACDRRRITSYGQLESPWPVHGSVLVQNGEVWFSAGRSSYLDGGLYLFRLNAKTGEMISATRINSRDPETGMQPKGSVHGTTMPGVLPDILSSDGTSVYMRHVRFDLKGKRKPSDVPHLYSPAGFLDGSWWHRTYWMFGTSMGSNYGGWPRSGNRVPAGRLLVVGDSSLYGFGRNWYIHHGAHVGIDGATIFHYRPNRDSEHRKTFYRLFACESRRPEGPNAKKPRRGGPGRKLLWSGRLPVLGRAMVLTGNALFVSGPPDPFSTENPTAALRGRKGGVLIAVAPGTGKTTRKYELQSPPVFDGMAAASGKLCMATLDGKVICMAQK